ncbi:MAG TPA: hypothetical protein VET23_13200 [Chitinophagaceae bacterium]|nr:hypothetical protein [Chitinophagaceae bacterium]
MEIHAHAHTEPNNHGGKKFKHYFWEFFMLFLAVTLGFLVENMREHYIENERLHRYLKSLLLDIESNRSVLDSAVRENSKMIVAYDSLVNQLNTATKGFDRAAFARKLGAVWYRGFINRNETFEQMKSSGSLRYVKNFTLLTALLDYERKCNFAQYRTERFEQKYYTELFLPAIYRNYDVPCLHMLDSAYTNNPVFIKEQLKHIDILRGDEAKKFQSEIGSAFMLRLERLRVTIAAYLDAIKNGEQLKKIIKKEIQ